LFESLSDQSVLLTAFTFGLDEKGSSALNFIVRSANIRSKQWWMPYGDQALALRRDVFERFGGFRDDFKMMEDFDLVHRIRKDALQSSNDKIVILPDIVESSARRWKEKGVVKTSLLNWAFCAAYVYLNIHPDQIFKWYYG